MRQEEYMNVLSDYLGQYQRAKRRKERLEKRLIDIRGEINRENKQRVTGIAFRAQECQERICEQICEETVDLLKIMDIFDYLERNSTERNALEIHYIDGVGWERVAEEVNVSRSHIYNIRTAALKKLIEYKRVRDILNKYMGREKEE